MNNKSIAFIAGGVVLVLIVLSLFFGAFYTVDQGERGVKLRLGKVVSISDPGLSFKFPFAEDVKYISVQNRAAQYNRIDAYSNDQQPAILKVSVNYHISPSEVGKVYSEFGTIDALVDRTLSKQIGTQAETIFGQYTAISVVQNRAKFGIDLTNAIRNSVQNTPIIIDSVQAENVDFSDAYEKSVEARMMAEVAIQTRKQNLATEQITAQIAVVQAQGRADSQLAEAKANAASIILRGNAEAESIKARGDALRLNPSIVSLTSAEKWNGILPSTMVPAGAVPFLNVNPIKDN